MRLNCSLLIFFAVFSLTAAMSANAQNAAASVDTIKFKMFRYVDQNGLGVEAFSMLIPSDWQFGGGIKWTTGNPTLPATAAFQVTNPNKTAEFEVFPNQPFFWSNNQMLLSTFPVGSRYFGNEVLPPMDAVNALQKIVLPRFRGRAHNLRTINMEPLPELARALSNLQGQPGISTSASGAKIRIEYTLNGQPVEEEIFGVVEAMSFPIQGMYGPVVNTNWTLDYLFSFKAVKGSLDSQAKLFKTMATSFKLNPQWFARYNQLVEYLIKNQIQQINNIGELSRRIARNSNEISDMIMDSYNKRQAVQDEIATKFSQSIRGVDEYANPSDGSRVELPSGYNNAWVNGLGEYVVAEDPSFNPNVGSNLNWQQLERR